MQNRIAKLSPLIINQIAAGEVVTRPASVVKELIENAIDAGADCISVYIEQGGLGLIQVIDNGQGIHPDDMTLAVTRHATSKLADVSELTGIDSLGFRGEALASICAVSHLTLTSSHDDSGIGRQLALSGSDASHATITPVVKNRGTTVSVRDLYFNIPARRSHLKSIATEFSHIEQVIQKIAISFAHVEISLYHQNKLRFSLSSNAISETKNTTALTRLEQALNTELQPIAHDFYLSLQPLQTANDLQKSDNQQSASINGWLFIPQYFNQTVPRLLYINQRLVTDFAISQALSKSARQADVEGLGYALFFDLPNEWININIHPSKQQVKIQPLTNMLAWLNQAVVDTLKAKSQASDLQQPQFQTTVSSSKNIVQKPSKNAPFQAFNNAENLPYPNGIEKNHGVNERQFDYQFDDFKESQFSPTQLFDDSPKFLKLMENGTQGLIFWQEDFYLVELVLITKAVLEDKNKFESLLKNSDKLMMDLVGYQQ
ncbi:MULTISPECIES: DNA mismatch repair endonuclease MutL [unclassified Moraxella]|uniref:DNA mismatch repair endonuclease MutL n=1 Tax=unclassified Moraxella TaxID=2685852 RepID=UPI003AF63119